MIEKKDVFHINFYKKEPFSGSCSGMRYRIEAQEGPDGQVLRATYWPGPYNFESTPREQKKSEDFPFSEEGLQAAVDWLNAVWEQEYRDARR